MVEGMVTGSTDDTAFPGNVQAPAPARAARPVAEFAAQRAN